MSINSVFKAPPFKKGWGLRKWIIILLSGIALGCVVFFWSTVRKYPPVSWIPGIGKSTKKDTTQKVSTDSILISMGHAKAWVTEAKEWKQKFLNEVKSHNQDNTDWQRKLDSLKSVGCKTSIAKVTHHKKKKHHAPVYQTHHYVGGGSSGYFEHPHRHKSKRPCN